VIFYDITGFLRGGFLPIISMYQCFSDNWFLGENIALLFKIKSTFTNLDAFQKN